MTNIRKILGSMSFGGAVNEAQAHQMLKDWIKLGHMEVDTAIMYQRGKTEQIIGKLQLCTDSNKVKIACKVNPLAGFKCEQVVEQLNTSLECLQTSSVDILYLHLPDHKIAIEETLKGVDQLYKEGKFKEFGLSNYASWEVVDIYHICKSNGYVLPTVYQGMYNALTRDIELELIPALRRLGMRFYVYNPLAGGLLSGKYNFKDADENQPKGRFFSGPKGGWSSEWTAAYRDRFWGRSNYKDGVINITSVLNETYNSEVTLLEASMRWLRHHSKLTDDDGIIFGFSKPEHFKQNIEAFDGGPLDDRVVQAFDEAWNNIKSDCPKYNR